MPASVVSRDMVARGPGALSRYVLSGPRVERGRLLILQGSVSDLVLV